MAEDKVEPREVNWRALAPWTALFQAFRIALDPNKLVLAACGILAMALGWWLLALIFSAAKPTWPDKYPSADYGKKDDPEAVKKQLAWDRFKRDRARWNLLHEMRAPADSPETWEIEDLADTLDEYDRLQAARNQDWAGLVKPVTVTSFAEIDVLARDNKIDPLKAKAWKTQLAARKPAGALRTWPWDEDRGPNPYLLVSGQAGRQWDKGQFWDWLFTRQIPVLLEPVRKLFLPVWYFMSPKAGPLVQFYSLLAILWALAVWAFFGGAISRIAAVQAARQEKISLREAVRFTARRYLSYFSAPVFPILFVAGLVLVLVVFGLFVEIPLVGEVLAGLLYPIPLAIALAMAVVVIGLISWPLMTAAIATEGTDSWEAVSRSYSYLYQAPWHFLWYVLVCLAYGAVVVFFVSLVGSLTVYLSKWGLSQAPGNELFNRNPSFLYVYAPESYGWRDLMLQGTHANGSPLTDGPYINTEAYNAYLASFKWYNHLGAFLVSVLWLGLVLMLVLGFAYSFFWSAATLIYLLMRRRVDDADLDEVYLDEEDEPTWTSTSSVTAGTVGAAAAPAPTPALAPAPAPAPAPAGTVASLPIRAEPAGTASLPIVEPPPAPAAPVAPPAPKPNGEDKP